MPTLSVASLRFTPDYPMPLAGVGSRIGPYEQVDQDLEAVFLRLSGDNGDTVVLGSIDTLFLTERTLRDIRAALGDVNVPLCLFATHTHNAPSLAPDLPLLGEHDPAWYRAVIAACANAIHTLVTGAQPVERVGLCYGERQTNLNINRRTPCWVLDYHALIREGRLRLRQQIEVGQNRRGTIDRRVKAIFLETGTGEVCSVIWSLAAHPARYPRPYNVSPDFPGLVRRALRRRFGPECAVIYLPGLAGSAVPFVPQGLPSNWKEWIRCALPFCPTVRLPSVRAYYSWVDRVAAELLAAYDTRGQPAHPAEITVEQTTVPGIFRNGPGSDPINLQVARVTLASGLEMLAYNGEMLAEWSPLLENVVNGTVLFSGYLAGAAIYVPTSAEIPKGGYEITRFQHRFGLNGEFHPDISRMVVGSTHQICGRFHTEEREVLEKRGM